MDDFTYKVIKEQISNENFSKKYLSMKAYNGMTRGSMSREEYYKLIDEINLSRIA